MRDTFPRFRRFGPVTLDCAECSHFAGPPDWPDRERVSRCSLHGISLAAELGPKGFKSGEWFCRDFDDAGHTIQQGPMARLFNAPPPTAVSAAALKKLDEIRPELQTNVLYGLTEEGRELKEIPFAELLSGRE